MPVIYEHLLKFRRGIDAERAKPAVSGLIDVTRIRTGEIDWPVVIFQTNYPLLESTCTRLQRLANVSAKFNILVTTGRIEDAPLTPEPVIYQHLLTFSTSDQATIAAHDLSQYVDLGISRSKVCEAPMVVFETEDWLEPEICRLLQGDLMPVRIAYNLTPEQARLYEYLQTYCNEHHMWCGNASELATFANLSYPFDPNIVWELVERRLIEHHAVQRYCLTISQVEEV